jgi:hypothetical protein
MNVHRSNRWLTALALAGAAFLTMAVSAPAARAATETFVTPGGAAPGGNPVNASATFTSSAGKLIITLTDLLANPKTVAQLLSDLSFTVSGGSATLTGSSLSSSSGQEITVAGNGTATTGSTVATGWPYSFSGSVGTLNRLAGSGANHLIIGPPGAGGIYSNANSSIAGNVPHNPFLNQSATFTISGSGITAATVVTAATFSFGTTSGVNVNGVPVPEPSTMAIAGLGAIGFIGFGLRRRLKK